MHQLSQVSFSLSFLWLNGSVLFGLAFIRQTGSAGFNGEPLKAKVPKFHLIFIKYAFGVLYKIMVIVKDGQLLEAGKTNQHTLFGLCCQLILTTISLIICLLCPLPIRLVGRHVF
jgi:hypothetical protein